MDNAILHLNNWGRQKTKGTGRVQEVGEGRAGGGISERARTGQNRRGE